MHNGVRVAVNSLVEQAGHEECVTLLLQLVCSRRFLDGTALDHDFGVGTSTRRRPHHLSLRHGSGGLFLGLRVPRRDEAVLTRLLGVTLVRVTVFVSLVFLLERKLIPRLVVIKHGRGIALKCLLSHLGLILQLFRVVLNIITLENCLRLGSCLVLLLLHILLDVNLVSDWR